MSNSVVVTTEEELRVACEKKVEHILIKGDLAKTVEKNMKQRKTRKKFMIGSVAIAGLGFIAAPFTGGASIPIAGLLAAAEEGGAVGGAASFYNRNIASRWIGTFNNNSSCRI